MNAEADKADQIVTAEYLIEELKKANKGCIVKIADWNEMFYPPHVLKKYEISIDNKDKEVIIGL